MTLVPHNRHLLVNPVEEDEIEETSILLPDDYKKQNPYGAGVVTDMASDCTLLIDVGDTVLYSTSTLESIMFGGKEFFLLLENYVLGTINEAD